MSDFTPKPQKKSATFSLDTEIIAALGYVAKDTGYNASEIMRKAAIRIVREHVKTLKGGEIHPAYAKILHRIN